MIEKATFGLFEIHRNLALYYIHLGDANRAANEITWCVKQARALNLLIWE